MSYFALSGSFGNKRREFPPIVICELAQEAKRNSTMQNAFSGLFVQPLERKNFFLLFATEDKREGMQAFIEKRKAAFQGR